MKRLLTALALVTALPIFADDRKSDGKEAVGKDRVAVYWCPMKKEFWTESADAAMKCPNCDNPKCGQKAGEYKVQLRVVNGTLKSTHEVPIDVELFQQVIDKDMKPDDVPVLDMTKVSVKFVAGADDKDGNFVRGDASELLQGASAGKTGVFVVKYTFPKKGDYLVLLTLLRGDKGKTKIDSEIRISVE